MIFCMVGRRRALYSVTTNTGLGVLVLVLTLPPANLVILSKKPFLLPFQFLTGGITAVEADELTSLTTLGNWRDKSMQIRIKYPSS